MRIAVFGASVSAQSTQHQTGEITGYSEVLRLRHQTELGSNSEDIARITFPGNRLSDGGLLRLRDVIAFKPDICLFEPLIEDLTRGIAPTKDEISYIYASLVEAGILPVTVMLPLPKQRKPSLHYAYNRYNDFCVAHNLPVVEVDLTNIGPLSGRFQGVHTLNAGARIYARQIIDGLKVQKLLEAPKLRLDHLTSLPKRSELSVSITPLDLSENLDTLKDFTFYLRPSSENARQARLVQLHQIGPFSPMLDVTVHKISVKSRKPKRDAQSVYKSLSVWDPYCHYARRSFVTLATIDLHGRSALSVHISQSAAEPAYSTSRREVSDWPLPADRRLQPLQKAYLIADGPVTIGALVKGDP